VGVDCIRCRLEAEGVKILTGTNALKAAAGGSSVLLRVAPANGEGIIHSRKRILVPMRL
jgi:hypothetical protein